MSYVKHNFEPGDILYASELNEIDDQIVLNEQNIDNIKSHLEIEQKIIPMAYIASNGVVTGASEATPWNLMCLKLPGGINIDNVSVTSLSGGIVWGSFTSEPFMGSVTYNNSRTSSGGALSYDNIAQPVSTSWIAFRYNPDDDIKIKVLNVFNLGNAIINKRSPSVSDANTAPSNSFIYNSRSSMPSNYPPNLTSVAYFETLPFNTTNKLQVAYDGRGSGMALRAQVNGTWSNWIDILTDNNGVTKNELYATSSVSLFPNIGCCGDSFSVGYLYNKSDSPYYDPDYVPNGEYPAISYGKCMGRMYGVDVSLFAKGGLTSGQWRTDAAGLTALEAADPQNLYIICLGLNDKTQNVPIGVEADIDTEPGTPTYLGNMGAIIRAINTHAPLSKIILLKSPWVYNAGGSSANAYYNYNSSAIELLSSHLGIPYIETLGDPFFCCDAYVNGLKGLHPTAPLYAGMGKRIGELVGKCVIDNPTYFFNFYVPNP